MPRRYSLPKNISNYVGLAIACDLEKKLRDQGIDVRKIELTGDEYAPGLDISFYTGRTKEQRQSGEKPQIFDDKQFIYRFLLNEYPEIIKEIRIVKGWFGGDPALATEKTTPYKEYSCSAIYWQKGYVE